jgi:hypothetical protein
MIISPGALVVIACLATVMLVGCRDEEQGRVLAFDKGHYAGAPVTKPSAQALAALHDRAQLQRY